jgi:adenine phosphoribosyltransferase
MTKISSEIKNNLKVVKDFPIKGINFQDIFSLTKNPKIFKLVIRQISKVINVYGITKIVGIESRGFLFGMTAAYKEELPFIPIRKSGKLPGKISKIKYKLEYGHDIVEIQSSSIKKSDKILLVDDLIATGGTAVASVKLLRKFNNKRIVSFFVVDLENLKGSERLNKQGIETISLYKTQG